MESMKSADCMFCSVQTSSRCEGVFVYAVIQCQWDSDFLDISSLFAERPGDGSKTRLQPSIPPSILETAPNILLKPPQSPCLLPFHWSLLSLHISGVQGWTNFR